MPRFRTQFDDNSPRFTTNPGSPEKDVYLPEVDTHGILSLKPVGKSNLYAEIQSHADSVDIHLILQRYQETQDPSLFARVQGAYGDFTQMPTTFAGALNTLIAAEQYFNGLPVDVRAQFGHSFNQFIASMDRSDFSSRMGLDKRPEDFASAPVSAAQPATSAGGTPPGAAGQQPPPPTGGASSTQS